MSVGGTEPLTGRADNREADRQVVPQAGPKWGGGRRCRGKLVVQGEARMLSSRTPSHWCWASPERRSG